LTSRERVLYRGAFGVADVATGSFFVETIYQVPGIGRHFVQSISGRDYPVIIALNFIAAVLTLVGTLLSDLLYMVVDPRIRL